MDRTSGMIEFLVAAGNLAAAGLLIFVTGL